MAGSISESGCPFCTRLAGERLEERNGSAAAFPDGYPVSPGHTLIVPIRHEPDFLKLPADEQAAVWQLVRVVAQRIRSERAAAGFNIGINIGEDAGQTVPHAHVHIIPRYLGDAEDPRGGVRWVLPDRARYW